MSDSLRPYVLSPPGSSVHGIFQARILEWVAISFSRGSSQPRDQVMWHNLVSFNMYIHLKIFVFFGGVGHVTVMIPDQGLNPCPQYWKHSLNY